MHSITAALGWAQSPDLPRLVNRVSISYCAHCGGNLMAHWFVADGRERLVCSACREVAYQNPLILVTCLVTWGERLLLAQRAHAPKVGLWCPPSGFMELGETPEQGAAREVREETGVVIDPEQLHLHLVSSIPRISEVYIGFRACVEDPSIQQGPEVLAAAFFDEGSLPWSDLAFEETEEYLRLFFTELAQGTFGIHLARSDSRGGQMVHYCVKASSRNE